jgi:hypothetical protein
MRVNGYIKKYRNHPPPQKKEKKKETHLEKDIEKNGWIFGLGLGPVHELL